MPERAANMTAGERLSVGLVVGRPLTTEHAALHCGVRDYAVRLAEALQDKGVEVRVIAPASWGLRDGLAFIRTLRTQKLDVLHLQYPAIGHRRSLLPHGLGLAGAGRRFVVTLHEHSALQRAQRAANRLFRTTADRLVFTTEFEARAFGASAECPVIPIGSNVPVHPAVPERDDTVLYFGQIRPHKGLEAFVALAALGAAAGEPTRFVVIGSAPPRWHDYARTLRAEAPANVSWVLDAPLPAVAQAMATAMAGYLPFPDGAGLRRGSLLAALSNGLPVVAPFGPSTTDELRVVLLRADTPEEALTQLRVLRSDAGFAGTSGAAGRALVGRFDWGAIAQEHVALYRSVLAGHAPAIRRQDDAGERSTIMAGAEMRREGSL
jgi:glycosyltransferase involved in cell wall biosynthesis